MKKYDVIALGELLIDFTENGQSVNQNPLLEANPGGAPCNVLAMLQNFVHTAADGDRSFSFYRNPGADMMLTKDEIDYSKIEDAKIFHFGTLSMTHEGVREATKQAVSRAKEKGLIISFDPNYRPLLWKDAEVAKEMMRYGFSVCDILKISDDEITFVTGKGTIEEAITAFCELYQPKLMSVTCGKNGSIVIYEGMKVSCAGHIRPDTIETTGAGDTFMGCMLNYVLEHGLEELGESDLMEMQKFAGTAAALITTRRGALKVMPTKEEILAELNNFLY